MAFTEHVELGEDMCLGSVEGEIMEVASVYILVLDVMDHDD